MERLDRRNRYQKHYDLGGGQFRLESHSMPIHENDGLGNWVEIDNYLEPITDPDYSHKTRRHDFEVKLSKYKQPLEVSSNGETVKVDPQGASQVTGIESGNQITYIDAYNNVDVERIIVNGGLKTNYILKGAGHPTSFSFKITGKREWIKKPFFEGLNDGHKLSETHPIDDSWNGDTYTFILPDLTGLTYPITIDPSIAPLSGTGDGRVRYEAAAAWDTAHSAGSGADVVTTDTTGQIGAWRETSAPIYSIRRSAFFFDTSAIPDGSTIDSITLTLVADSVQNSGDTYYVTPYTETALDNVDDYVRTKWGWTGSAFPNGGSLLISTTGSKVITVDKTVITINQSGTTSIGLLGSKDWTNTAPTDNTQRSMVVRWSDYTGTTSDPVLTVNYTEGGAGTAVKDIIGLGFIPFSR